MRRAEGQQCPPGTVAAAIDCIAAPTYSASANWSHKGRSDTL